MLRSTDNLCSILLIKMKVDCVVFLIASLIRFYLMNTFDEMPHKYLARSLVWFINDELRSVGRGTRGAVTFPRLLLWQPVWTYPGAQGPSDINLIILSMVT